MSHIDDGRLNALLDGELDAVEADAVRAHIAGCAECAKRLEEARQFLAQAANLLGSLDLPATVNVPAAPVRRVSKTAKEVAVDIDGATHKSPAIRPNLREPVPPTPAARPHFDFTTLSWAAVVVLAIGVTYLVNEVRHAHGGVSEARDMPAPAAAPSAAATPVASAARTDRPGTRRTALTAAPHQVAPERPARSTLRATGVAAKAAPPSDGKRLAATNPAAPHRQPARPAASNELAAAAGAGAPAQLGAAARRAAEPAPAPAAVRPVGGNAAELSVTGVAASRDALASFRRVTLEEAVARLNGIIRLMDGMRFEQVELGPGRLVPGADHDRELVRLVYVDAAGRRLVLDEQRITLPATGGLVSSDIGLRAGDTLTTTTPGGEMRLRWIDGTFWLSLTGNLPPDELRRLIERVR